LVSAGGTAELAPAAITWTGRRGRFRRRRI